MGICWHFVVQAMQDKMEDLSGCLQFPCVHMEDEAMKRVLHYCPHE